MSKKIDNVPYLKIHKLTKNFGAFTALDDISLEVREGEFMCFLGPSGCGKTTLLRAISGLDIQTHGQIFQEGNDISDLPPAERDFGIVFQSYALFPNLTVAKNIAYGLENTKQTKTEIQDRVEELLVLVRMLDQADKYPAQLSGGQQQRVALARAIAISPGLLLLDEPLSALDAKVRIMLRAEIKELQHRLGITTVMVTHDQEEALTMADRIVVMNNGKIEQIGTPEEIYHTPYTRFVAGFIGTMNFLPAELVSSNLIKVGETSFECENTTGSEPKTPIVASIRPEDIVVNHSDCATSENTLDVSIEKIEFLGSFCRAVLRSEKLGEEELVADLPSNFMRENRLSEGNRISVSLPWNCIRIYPA